MKKILRLLAIETSCDETAAAVLEFNVAAAKSFRSSKGAKEDAYPRHITPLSSVVASQVLLHKKFGGVYPEMASRAHSQKILPVVSEALWQAGVMIHDSRFKNQKVSLRGANSPKQSGPLLSSRACRGIPSTLSKTRSLRMTPVCHLSPLISNKVDAIAVTTGPGLVGSLIVGVEFARGLSAATGITVVPVNHLEGHIYAATGGVNNKLQKPNSKQISNSKYQNPNQTTDDQLLTTAEFPILALVVSGGHTILVHMRKHLGYKVIGSTLDDAAGESFDKVARMLRLPYPGGPALEKLARNGNPKAYDFPRSMLHSNDFNFSFSGLKTAVFYKLRSLGLVNTRAEPIPPPVRELKLARDNPNSSSPPARELGIAQGNASHFSPPARGGARGGGRGYPQPSALTSAIIRDTAASFQQAVIDVLVAKTLKAAAELGVKSIFVGGGVIANSALRDAFQDPHKLPLGKGESKRGFKVYLSPKELATDNALSIGIAGAYHFARGHTIPWQELDASASQNLA